MSTSITVKAKFENVRGMLMKRQSEMASIMPKVLSPERLTQLTLSEFRRNPKLLDCTLDSVFNSVMQAARRGWEIGDGSAHCHLVPFNNKGKNEAQLIPGYRGLVDLVWRTGQLDHIDAQVVYEKDEFDVQLGDTPKITHRPYRGDEEPGQLVATYAVARIKGSAEPQRVVLWPRDIRKIRASSRGSSRTDSPWNTWEEGMWKKSAIRRLCNLLPMSSEVRSALDLDAPEPALPENQPTPYDLDITAAYEEVEPEAPEPEPVPEQRVETVPEPPAPLPSKPVPADAADPFHEQVAALVKQKGISAGEFDLAVEAAACREGALVHELNELERQTLLSELQGWKRRPAKTTEPQ